MVGTVVHNRWYFLVGELHSNSFKQKETTLQFYMEVLVLSREDNMVVSGGGGSLRSIPSINTFITTIINTTIKIIVFNFIVDWSFFRQYPSSARDSDPFGTFFFLSSSSLVSSVCLRFSSSGFFLYKLRTFHRKLFTSS